MDSPQSCSKTIQNAQDLQEILSLPNPLGYLLGIDESSAPDVIDLLYKELQQSTSKRNYRKRCMKYLKVMSKKFHVLPPSIFMNNIVRIGDHPLKYGGFADIYKGKAGDEDVCLKVVRVHVAETEDKRKKIIADFCQEAILWTQLRHANVIPLLGVNTVLFPSCFCLVSPWMVNGDIVSFLKANPRHDKLKAISEIMAGLEYLHSLSPPVVHGDIKGANILVSEDRCCLLADFGLAAVTAETLSMIHSASEVMKGSIRWMAPELYASTPGLKGDKTPQDVYAFACTVFEILSGKLPFFNLKGDAAVIYQVTVLRIRPERPSGCWCPDHIWNLVEICWDENPLKRPKAKALHTYLRDVMVSKKPAPFYSEQPATAASGEATRLESSSEAGPSPPPNPPPPSRLRAGPKQSSTSNILRSRLQTLRDRDWLLNIPTVPTAPELAENLTKLKKKALLIGVQYSTMGENALKGPYRDVAVMKKLLVEQYQYHPKDIVTLVDIKDTKQKQPTHDNMVRAISLSVIYPGAECGQIEEMRNLVKGAAPGARLFFHYSGHATQVHDKNNKEEDGMDECIVPCDCVGSPEDPKLIRNDVLKKILVDSLPTGSHLVAIFDCTHSASLLDLEHLRCNRVYVPWISKGRRRSDSMWYANGVVARLSFFFQAEPDPSPVRQNAALVNTRTIHQTSRSSLDVSDRMNSNVVKTRRTSLDLLSEQLQSLTPTPASHFVESTQEPSSSNSASSSRSQSPIMTARAGSLDRPQRQRTGSITRNRRRQSTSSIRSSFVPWLEDRPGQEEPLCESPVEMYCTGWCRSGQGSRTPVDPSADVICLGSCKDSQTAWEDLSGTSMTQSLVEILRIDPHPTLKEFMTGLSHAMHDRLLRMHEAKMEYKKARKWWRIGRGKKAPPEADPRGRMELNNFQDPQMSSHKPLDMDSRLVF
ncbi:kinase-like protein [Marasmius fiardii PR-910]|nr:kinase-like protein [Marasmius fiardii PR-910]